MKKYLNLNNILCLILSLYLTLVITFVANADLSLIILGPIIFGTLFFVIKKVFDFLNKINLESSTKITKKELLIYISIIFGFMALFLLINRPTEANVSPDTINQFKQALENLYSDWHPLMHTLLFFKLPTLIYPSLFSCAIIQVLFIGFIMLYFACFCRKYFLNNKETIFILIIILANPIFIRMATTLWKDIPFTFSMMLLTMILIEISITKGKILNNKKQQLLFIVSSFGVIFFRHNGILSFLIMMLLLIIFTKNHKRFYILVLIILFSLKLLTGPIYAHFNIGENGGIAECLGVPLNQMSYIFNKNGKVTDDELNLMNNISSLEYWKKNFKVDSFNEIKWYGNYDYNFVKNNYKKILATWYKMVIDNPKLAIESYVNVTSPIWEIKYPLSYNYNYISDITFANYVYTDYYNVVEKSFLRLFVIDHGEGLFLTLLALALVISKNRLNIETIIPFSLTISNTLIIMLLITGGEVRFVYSQIICTYPLILYALRKSDYVKNDIKNNTLIQFFKYFIVGLIAAIVNIASLYLFTDTLKINYIISNVFAFMLGLITNYILSKKYVFINEEIKNTKIEFIIYGLIGITGLIIDTLILFILVDKFKIYYMIGKVISTLLVFIWNFGVRKIFYKVVGGKL